MFYQQSGQMIINFVYRGSAWFLNERALIAALKRWDIVG
jgi:hypothetical protein